MIGKITEWAKKWGISEQAARSRIRKHQIPKIGHGSIDFEDADRIWNASENVSHKAGMMAAKKRTDQKIQEAIQEPGPQDMSTSAKVGLKRDLLKIRREELTIGRLEKKLVPLADVLEFQAQMIARARSGMLSIATENRDVLAAEGDPIKCQEILEAAVNRALSEMAVWEPTAQDA